jgi:hypothetical protein
MADTGAPFNLPYPVPSDLVKDGADAIKDLAEAVADGLPRGLGTNVVQTVKTDTFTTTSASFVDITGMSVTITPSTNTSKVLVVATMVNARGGTGGTSVRINLVRNSTNIAQPASGSAAATLNSRFLETATNYPATVVFLDSPATTSAVTYKLQVAVSVNTFNFNLRDSDPDNSSISTITAIEVAA